MLCAFLATHREIRVPRGDTRVLGSPLAFQWRISAKTGGGISGITANTRRVNTSARRDRRIRTWRVLPGRAQETTTDFLLTIREHGAVIHRAL